MKSPLGSILNRSPVPYVTRNGTGGVSHSLFRRDNREAQMQVYGSVGTLFSVVNRLSNSTGAVEWTLYRKSPSGKKEDRVQVTSHAAIDLWESPNDFYTGQELREAGQQHQELTGETWLVIDKFPGVDLPLELWPVRPDRIYPVPDRDEFISGYVYKGPDGEKVPLEKDEVIHIKLPNPLDPYRGLGVVQSLLTDLDTVRYSAEWNRNFFINGAEPGGIIEYEEALQEEDFSRIRSRWNEQHKGVRRAHRVAVLEQGGKWKDRSYSMKDMQFVQLRQVSRDTIMEAFGVGKPMLGITDDVNRANAEAGEFVFSKYLSKPRLERWKGVLNRKILPMYGDTAKALEWDYKDPTPDNEEAINSERNSKASAAKELTDAGYHPDDVLKAVGLPAMRYVRSQEA